MLGGGRNLSTNYSMFVHNTSYLGQLTQRALFSFNYSSLNLDYITLKTSIINRPANNNNQIVKKMLLNYLECLFSKQDKKREKELVRKLER